MKKNIILAAILIFSCHYLNVHAKQIVKHENTGKCPQCKELLNTCTPILSTWFAQEQQDDPTLHIMQAYRGELEQNRALKAGASKVGWGKSAHNYIPCFAIDCFFLIDGKSKQIPAKYKRITSRLPETIENGSSFQGLIDWCHFQVKNWQTLAKNYPNGNLKE